MPSPRRLLYRAFDGIERAFDRLKLGFKWRFGWWENLHIAPFHGYGTPDRFRLRGRVLDDRRIEVEGRQSVWDNIHQTVRRVETDEIPGARLRVCYGALALEVETDEDGYFDAELTPDALTAPEAPWQEVALELLAPRSPDGAPVEALGRVLVPPDGAGFAVVSDIDDTVVRTGATSRLRMARTVLLNNPRSRVPFPGVGAFYRALQDGPDGQGHNPIFYISSSPWNLYDLFVTFMEAHDVPAGPLFLKDFGFARDHLMKSGHEEHKYDHIETLLETYPQLPFVLIGDSGQQDPEIYSRVLRDHPERIRAVFIRDVTPEARDAEVQQIADRAGRHGVPFVLVEDTVAAARRAHALGLINQDAVEAVRQGHAAEADATEEGGPTEEGGRAGGLLRRLVGAVLDRAPA